MQIFECYKCKKKINNFNVNESLAMVWIDIIIFDNQHTSIEIRFVDKYIYINMVWSGKYSQTEQLLKKAQDQYFHKSNDNFNFNY